MINQRMPVWVAALYYQLSWSTGHGVGFSADKEEIIDDRTGDAKRGRYLAAYLSVLGLVTFFFGLGDLAFLGPDEPRYAEVAREMYVSGDYLSPRLAGCLWLEKPVLFYWLAAGAYHVFGVNEFAARAPSAFGALAMLLLLFQVLRRVVSLRYAVTVSAVFATSGIIIGFARAATPDMSLTAAMCFALIAGFQVPESKGHSRLIWVTLCAASAGVAMLAKGLVGIVFVTAILAAYYLITRRFSRIRWQEWLYATVIFLAVASFWYLPITLEHGWKFINEFFIEHHFYRYTTPVYRHPQPFYFYILIAAAGVLPWSFFLIPAVARIRRLRPAVDRFDRLITFAWIWVAVPVLFFSFSESKLPGYILPVFPALAIIIGADVERVWAGEKSRALTLTTWLTTLMLIALGIGLLVYLSGEGVNLMSGHLLYLSLPLVASIVGAVAVIKNRAKVLPVAACAVVAGVVIVAAVTLLQHASNKWSLKQLSLDAASALRPGELITFYVRKEYAPAFYAQGRVVCGVSNRSILNAVHPDKIVTVLQTSPSVIVITTQLWLDDLARGGRFIIEPIASQRDVLAARVRLK